VVEKNNTAEYLIYGAQERALMGTESAVTHIKGFESGHSEEKMVSFNFTQNKMINMQYMNSIALQLKKGKVTNHVFQISVIERLRKGRYLLPCVGKFIEKFHRAT
jgi:hypothetical protein